MPLFQVPSSVVDDSPGGNDSAEMFKLQNPLFQHAFKKKIPILQHRSSLWSLCCGYVIVLLIVRVEAPPAVSGRAQLPLFWCDRRRVRN